MANHHLLFADMALKEQGFAELLPLVDTLIIDEAHQIPDIATRFFGVELTNGQLFELARDTVAAMRSGRAGYTGSRFAGRGSRIGGAGDGR